MEHDILGKTQRVKPSHCCYCGQLNDGASGMGHDYAPRPGDVMICLGCSGLNIYVEGGRLRLPTPAETKATSTDLNIQMARMAAFTVALSRGRRR